MPETSPVLILYGHVRLARGTSFVFALLALALILWSAPANALAQEPQQVEVSETPLTITRADGMSYSFTAELALTAEEQRIGMMFRDVLADDRGMLFVFPRARAAAFWMRNTVIPLDLIFVKRDGTIANIVRNAEPLTETSRRSKGRVVAVFEVRGGLTEELGIEAGDLVRHPKLPAG